MAAPQSGAQLSGTRTHCCFDAATAPVARARHSAAAAAAAIVTRQHAIEGDARSDVDDVLCGAGAGRAAVVHAILASITNLAPRSRMGVRKFYCSNCRLAYYE